MDGDAKVGGPIEEQTESLSEVVKAHERYNHWRKQKESFEQPMEVEKVEKDGQAAEGDDDGGSDDEGQCVEYFTEIDNETPEMIAVKFGVDVADILDVNKERFKRKLTMKSKFFPNTLLWIPIEMEGEEEPVAAAASGEPVTTATSGEPVATAISGEPVAAAISGEPAAVASGEHVAVASGEPVATATSGEPVAAATSGEPAAVASGKPVAAASGEPVATATSGEPVAATTSGEPAAVASGEPVAAASGEPVATATSGEPVATATSGEPVAATTSGEPAAEEDDEATRAAAPVAAKQAKSGGIRSFAPPFDQWGFRSKRRGASAAATCGAIDVYLYPPGETKPQTSKIGVTKWICQNEGKVTSEMDEGVVAAMWSAARGACDSMDIVPRVAVKGQH